MDDKIEMIRLPKKEGERINYELIFVILTIATLLIIFVGKPMYINYIEKKQLEAQELLVYNILLRIQNEGYVDIPLGNETLRLIPIRV